MSLIKELSCVVKNGHSIGIRGTYAPEEGIKENCAVNNR
jgi:hypothetical protein